MRAVSVAKYQPPREHLGGRRRRRSGAPSASSTTRSANGRGELGVVRGDEHRRAAGGELAAGARRARPWRRGPCRASARRGRHRRRRRRAEDDREREPLALAAREVARVAVGETREPGRGERRRRRLVADALVEQVVAGVLQQQRDAAGRAHLAAGRLEQPGGDGAAASTCPAPLRPISATRSPGRDGEVDAAQQRRPPPRARARRRSQPQRGRRVAPLAAARAADSRGVAAPLGSSPCARSVARASLTPAGGGRRPARCEQAGAGRLQRGRAGRRPLEELARRRVAGDRAVVAARARGRPRPGSARGGARRARPPSPTPR